MGRDWQPVPTCVVQVAPADDSPAQEDPSLPVTVQLVTLEISQNTVAVLFFGIYLGVLLDGPLSYGMGKLLKYYHVTGS